MSETVRLLSDKCSYRDHLNNPKSYKYVNMINFINLKFYSPSGNSSVLARLY